jgi:hypothetical protein
MPTSVLSRPLPARGLLDARLFRHLVADLAARFGEPLAERIVDQTAAFLSACSANPDVHLVPSRLVDAGWHAFLLHTREYAAFCTALGGPFIHHQPDTDTGEVRPAEEAARELAHTVEAILAEELLVDHELWAAAANCADQGNCSASGKDGTENEETRVPKTAPRR